MYVIFFSWPIAPWRQRMSYFGNFVWKSCLWLSDLELTSLSLKSSGFINTKIFDKFSFLEGQMESPTLILILWRIAERRHKDSHRVFSSLHSPHTIHHAIPTDMPPNMSWFHSFFSVSLPSYSIPLSSPSWRAIAF